jgi:hypothetical protein
MLAVVSQARSIKELHHRREEARRIYEARLAELEGGGQATFVC